MPSVESLVDDVIRAADTLRELPPPESLVQALNRLATEDTTRTGRVRMAARLRDVTSPAGCGFLCICLGASVEGDADPAPVTPLIIDAMLRWIATIPRPEDRPREDRPGQAEMQAVRDRLGYTLEDADSDDDPIDLPPELTNGLDWMGQGLVAHLSRDEPARQVLASRSEAVAELDRAAGHCNGATWVLELLRKRSGELVVIHVPSGRGVLAKFENISNGFHLFTLLQGALSGVIPARDSPMAVHWPSRGGRLKPPCPTAPVGTLAEETFHKRTCRVRSGARALPTKFPRSTARRSCCCGSRSSVPVRGTRGSSARTCKPHLPT